MIQTKALYNLLRLNAKEDPTLKADPWALEDFRKLSVAAIFRRLVTLNVRIDEAGFLQFAEECDSPEELLELLVDEEGDPKTQDHIYLLLFELWRRLLPDKQSLSIFCDELDHIIQEYEEDRLKSDEPIQDGLANLLDVLREHVDQKMAPKEAFRTISDYCGHDLECFLFEMITELLDENNESYARELLEEFEPYIEDSLQAEFLAARLYSFTDIKETNRRIAALLKKKLEAELLFEIIQLLVATGDHSLFQLSVKKLLPELKTEEEFQDLLELTADYFRRLDQDEKEKQILTLKKKRSKSQEFNPKDPDLHKFEALLA